MPIRLFLCLFAALFLAAPVSAQTRDVIEMPKESAEPSPDELIGQPIIPPAEGEDPADAQDTSPDKAEPEQNAKATPVPAIPEPPPESQEPEINAVRLQGLNKTTARVSAVAAPLGTVMRFGNLEIIAHRCWKSPPEDRPENAALLEIRELKPDETPLTVFQGWMFSSSPGLSALEHPVYDITVLACEHMDTEGE